MDRPSSQCTSGSGCESGWTLYLNQSTTLHQDQQNQHSHGEYRARGSLKTVYDHDTDHDGEEEDLSMVSDASSGPPNCHEDYDHDSFNGNGIGSHLYSASASDLAQSSKIMKMKSKSTDTKQRHSYLDDTASSPLLSFSKTNMNFSNKKPSMEHVSSEGFSATHFKGKSAIQKHFGFFKKEK